MPQFVHPDQALNTVLEAAIPIDPVALTLDQALDHVTAADVLSAEDLPAADVSTMDGFAVRSADLSSACADRPVRLPIVDFLPAGKAPTTALQPGRSVRIMTGAPLPAGADAVVPIEQTRGAERADSEHVEFLAPVRSGESTFARGGDVALGQVVVTGGTLLRPQELGALASVGIWEVMVHPRPRVAVLATGDELVHPSEPISPGKIRSSNSVTLVNQVRRYGAVAVDLGIAEDRLEEITSKLRLAQGADVVILSGGSAAGDHDFSERALLDLGVKIHYHRVAIRPGKPVLFGTLDRTLYFGLPGNPVSSMLTFELFVRPAILRLRGLKNHRKRLAEGTLQEDVSRSETGKRYFVRVRHEVGPGGATVTTSGPQGSGVLTSMVKSNALLVMDLDETFIAKGSRVTVWLMDDPEV